MATGTLTAVGVRTIHQAGKHFDGGGLYLHVQANGRRYWRMKYRFGGRENVLAFGVYPEVSLAEARQRRDAARALLRAGTDPAAQRDAEREGARRQTQGTFPRVAARWLASKEPGWSVATYRKARYVLATYLIPTLRRQSITNLTSRHACDALLVIARAAPSLASKARQYLNDIVTFAIRNGLRDEGRLLMLEGALPKRHKGHIPAATQVRELAALVKAVNAYPIPVTRAALQLTMWTAQRPGVVVSARWEEIDLDRNEWWVPAERMKTHHAHGVPLPVQAQHVLRAMHSYADVGHGYVFPPLARQRTPHLSRDALSAALRRLGFRGRHATHGFRGTLRTIGRERLGIDPDVLEAQLAHAKKGEVQKAYDHTRFDDARRDAMQRWADYLDSLAALPD